MSSKDESQEIVAAGGLLFRTNENGELEVLLVHRPRHNDWSFPKGKIDPNESIEEGAVREVAEETGLRCRIIRTFGAERYQYRTPAGNLRPKVVHYFFMEPVSGELRINSDEEIDAVRWIQVGEAGTRLSYEADRRLLEESIKKR
ncbi:MAG TPA: NUDIX hydrolase [Blastocatellia bacterium]|nr:NUDIX hydrolase [Blastocatellia bacterium]